MSLGGSNVVVAELYTSFEIVCVEFSSLAQLFEGFVKTLESLVCTRQAPVCRCKLLVDLDSIAKFKRRFLKLLVLQVGFAFFNVGYFGFLGIGTTAYCEDRG